MDWLQAILHDAVGGRQDKSWRDQDSCACERRRTWRSASENLQIENKTDFLAFLEVTHSLTFFSSFPKVIKQAETLPKISFFFCKTIFECISIYFFTS